MKTINDKLSVAEQHDLKKLEGVIQSSKEVLFRFGSAMEEIRDRRLYRAEHSTFEEYCQKRWGWGRRYVNYLIEGNAVVQALPKDLGTKVPNLAAARELGKVAPEARERVMTVIASSGKKATASAIKSVKPTDILLDRTGYPVPEKLAVFWNRSLEVQELLTAITRLRSRLGSASDDKDPLFAEMDFGAAASGLSALFANVKRAMPYAVCPQCQGRTEVNAKCQLCKGRGVISEFLFKNVVPEEIKKIRDKACKK